MIRIILGKMGSGKTSSVVREMVLNEDEKPTFSNIVLKSKKINHIQITKDMIFNKDVIGYTKDGKEKHKLNLNIDYWKEVREKYGSINIVIDEAHTLYNSRSAMSSKNKLFSEWLALLRRVVNDSNSDGSLTLISQLSRRIDIIGKELATKIEYCKMHYLKTCNKCKTKYKETNEDNIIIKKCQVCGYNKFKKSNFIIEKWEFQDTEACDFWLNTKQKTYFSHYYIIDIENYFKYYNTFQWEDLLSED